MSAQKGDTHIDDHHSVEDTGIALGQALNQALGDRRGITRYASIDLAMDEALTRAAVDVSGRPFLVWQVDFPTQKIGTFDTELVREFFKRLHNMRVSRSILPIYMALIATILPRPVLKRWRAPCVLPCNMTRVKQAVCLPPKVCFNP